MSDEGEANPIVGVTQEKPKKVSDWFPVSLRKDVIARIDRVFSLAGHKSRGEYVRVAVLAQLATDEAQKKEESSDVSTGGAGQPGV
jgi:hypothetical protein